MKSVSTWVVEREMERRTQMAVTRSIFITKLGYVGLGPPDSARGDTIAVILGTDVPFVLRPLGDHFQLIGETYVRGIMLGEALDELKKGTVDLSYITPE